MRIKNYLPSKKFRYLLGSFLVIALVFFVVFKLFSGKGLFASKNSGILGVDRLAQAGLTVNQLIQKDSDGDGVPDWEEALWGTDPHNKATFDGVPDAVYIANKKKELNMDQEKQDSANLTETDKFARDFFTAYTAMKTSGQVDDTAINNFSNALGQQITSSSLADQYSEKDITIAKSDTTEDQKNYYIAAGTLFQKYKGEGVGNELDAAGEMAAGGETGDTQSQNDLVKISGAYQAFAQKLLLVPVPQSLTGYDLKIINSANNTGIAVLDMSKMATDPITGISGVSQYEEYSADLIASVTTLESFLAKNGIIPSSDTTSDVGATSDTTSNDSSNLAPSDNSTSDTSTLDNGLNSDSNLIPDNGTMSNDNTTP